MFIKGLRTFFYYIINYTKIKLLYSSCKDGVLVREYIKEQKSLRFLTEMVLAPSLVLI